MSSAPASLRPHRLTFTDLADRSPSTVGPPTGAIQRSDRPVRLRLPGAVGHLVVSHPCACREQFAPVALRSTTSFHLPTLEEVQAVEAKLHARGVTPRYEGVVPHREGGESAALFFTDPDGIRLEVYSPTGAAGLSAPVAGAPSCGFF